jgi:hypothetical protein
LFKFTGDCILNILGEEFSMTTGETLQQEQGLTQRLQTELEFVPDETGEWLVNDDFTWSNGLNGNEFLPTRVRVAADGTRLEFGVYKEDLEKNLELAHIAGEDAKDLDFVRNFWPEGHRINTVEEEEVIFFGAAIEPTAEDFESQYQGIHNGLEVPLEAAARGMAYEDTKGESSILRFSVLGAETVRNDGGSVLFPKKEEPENLSDDAEAESGCPDYWDRSAENLRTFSIETWETFVSEAATELRIGDKIYIGTGLGRLNSKNRSGIVDISDSGYALDETTGKHEEIGRRWNLALTIPEDVEVKTVENTGQLTQAKLTLHEDSWGHTGGEPEEHELVVSVTVEDHELTIESEDGEFGVKFFEPACMRCETPIWKFEWPEELETERRQSGARSGLGFGGDIIMAGGSGSGNGVYYYSIGQYEYGKRKTTYCHDCFGELQEEFATEYPLARRENALAAVRAKLDEIGYSDVQLEPTQVWPAWPRRHRDGEDGDIEIFAFVEYERGARTIRRRAGVPTLTYDGKITPDMPSREYIEFR